MPRLSRWCIRTGLVYFLTGLLLGIGITFDAVEHSFAGRALWLVYLHLLVVGWITLLIVGVAFWILPRFGRERRRESWAAAAIIMLNIGLWASGLRFVLSDVLLPIHTIGRSIELVAAILFVAHVWTRLKPPGNNR